VVAERGIADAAERVGAAEALVDRVELRAGSFWPLPPWR
jgi:hypothetical protein